MSSGCPRLGGRDVVFVEISLNEERPSRKTFSLMNASIIWSRVGARWMDVHQENCEQSD